MGPPNPSKHMAYYLISFGTCLMYRIFCSYIPTFHPFWCPAMQSARRAPHLDESSTVTATWQDRQRRIKSIASAFKRDYPSILDKFKSNAIWPIRVQRSLPHRTDCSVAHSKVEHREQHHVVITEHTLKDDDTRKLVQKKDRQRDRDAVTFQVLHNYKTMKDRSSVVNDSL